MKMEKRLIRETVLNELTLLTPTTYRIQSERIAEQLYQQSYWQKAKTVALTVSRFPEVDTEPMIAKAWEEGKKVALPRINTQTKQMEFFIIETYQQLEETVFKLKEPIPSQSTLQSANDIDLMIVPGVAFTKQGYRLGLGGGYYDRYLPKFKGITVSLLFSAQLVDTIPLEEHDHIIDYLLSQGGRIK